MGRGRMGGRSFQTIPLMITAEEDFLDQVNDSLWKVGLIAAAVALVIGLILTRQITRPIRALISGARHLTKGELSYRVDVKSRDEMVSFSFGGKYFSTVLSLQKAKSRGQKRLSYLAPC